MNFLLSGCRGEGTVNRKLKWKFMFSVGKAAVITVAPVGGEKSTKLMSRMKMRSLLSKCLGALPARRNKGVDRKDAERGEGGTRMLRGATPASTCARCTRSTRGWNFLRPPLSLRTTARVTRDTPTLFSARATGCRSHLDRPSAPPISDLAVPFLSLFLISSLDFVALAQPCQENRYSILENNKTTNGNKFVKFWRFD